MATQKPFYRMGKVHRRSTPQKLDTTSPMHTRPKVVTSRPAGHGAHNPRSRVFIKPPLPVVPVIPVTGDVVPGDRGEGEY